MNTNFFWGEGSIMKPAAHVWMKIINIRMSFTFCANTSFCQILQWARWIREKRRSHSYWPTSLSFMRVEWEVVWSQGCVTARSTGTNVCREYSLVQTCAVRGWLLHSRTLSDFCECTSNQLLHAVLWLKPPKKYLQKMYVYTYK